MTRNITAVTDTIERFHHCRTDFVEERICSDGDEVWYAEEPDARADAEAVLLALPLIENHHVAVDFGDVQIVDAGRGQHSNGGHIVKFKHPHGMRSTDVKSLRNVIEAARERRHD